MVAEAGFEMVYCKVRSEGGQRCCSSPWAGVSSSERGSGGDVYDMSALRALTCLCRNRGVRDWDGMGWGGVGGGLFAHAMRGFRLVVVGCWGSTNGFGTGHHDCKEGRSICPLPRGWRSTVFIYFSIGRMEPSWQNLSTPGGY